MTKAAEWLRSVDGVQSVSLLEHYQVTCRGATLNVYLWKGETGNFTAEVEGVPGAAGSHVGQTMPTVEEALEQVREDFVF